ncbi:MAG TPA: hypothetical protein VNG33_23395 [Polyangiaceae bacterium]|nr:hypothetical protein [Polyangiaceae bacterium]
MVRFLGPAGSVLMVGLALVAGCGQANTGAPQAGGNAASSAGATSGGTSGAAGAGGSTSSTGGNAGTAGGASSGSAGVNGNDLADACIAYALALCKRRGECEGRLQDAASCLATTFSCPDVVSSLGSTRTVATLQACALAYATFSCDDMLAGKLPDCVTPGTLPRGAPCQYPSQCSTLACKLDGMTCGKCALMVGEQEACTAPDVDCLPEMYCDGTCVKRPTQGPVGEAGKPCTATCVTDYYCDPTSKLCVPSPSVGMSCQTQATCVSTAYCAPDTQLCQPLPAKDEPCAPDATGALVLCGHDLKCDFSKVPYACAPRGGPGTPCSSPGQDVCASGLTCMCPPETIRGASCTTRACYALSLGNQPCDNVNSQCHPGFTCTAGKCQPLASQGLLQTSCMP